MLKVRLLLTALMIMTISMEMFSQSSSRDNIIFYKPSDNQIVKEKITYKHENSPIKHGPYTYFYNGRPLVQTTYINDTLHGLWELFDYESQLRLTGHYVNGKKHGRWVSYRNDGSKVGEQFYRHGLKDSIHSSYDPEERFLSKYYYTDDVLDSSYLFDESGAAYQIRRYEDGVIKQEINFFPSGAVFYEMEYKDGHPYILHRQADLEGNPLESGNFNEGHGQLIEYRVTYNRRGRPRFTVLAKQNYRNGLREGRAEFYNEKGKLTDYGDYENGVKTGEWVETYGKIRKTKTYDPADSAGVANFRSTFDERFTIVEEMPEFPGGESQLIRFLQCIEYPLEAKMRNIEGSVYARFVVDKEGKVTDVEIARGAHEIINNAALEHIEKMPRWMPGYQRGMPVKVQFIVPLKFRLD